MVCAEPAATHAVLASSFSWWFSTFITSFCQPALAGLASASATRRTARYDFSPGTPEGKSKRAEAGWKRSLLGGGNHLLKLVASGNCEPAGCDWPPAPSTAVGRSLILRKPPTRRTFDYCQFARDRQGLALKGRHGLKNSAVPFATSRCLAHNPNRPGRKCSSPDLFCREIE